MENCPVTMVSLGCFLSRISHTFGEESWSWKKQQIEQIIKISLFAFKIVIFSLISKKINCIVWSNQQQQQDNVDEMVNTAEDFNLRWLYLFFLFLLLHLLNIALEIEIMSHKEKRELN